MPVTSISSQNINQPKYSIINPKTTGYVAAAGMGLTMISGMIKSKPMYKSHKYFAGVAFIATIIHLYLVLKRHKIKKNVQ